MAKIRETVAKIEIGKTESGGYRYVIRSGAFVWESRVEQDSAEEAMYYARIELKKLLRQIY